MPAIQIPNIIPAGQATQQGIAGYQNALATTSNLKTQGLQQNALAMRNQDMAKEQRDRAELESLLMSTPPDQQERVGLEFLKVRDPDRAARLQAQYLGEFNNNAKIDPQSAVRELERKTGEKIQVGKRYAVLPGEGGADLIKDLLTGEVKEIKDSQMLAAVKADLAIGNAKAIEGVRQEGRENLKVLEAKLRPGKQVERTVDLGDKVEYIYTDGTRETKQKGLTPGQAATSHGGGKPRYVQYSAPDGTFSRMVNVNDPEDRAEMEAKGWTPGAPTKMGAKEKETLETTQELAGLMQEIRALYKPGFVGKYDAGIKGNIQEFTGLIGPDKASFRIKVQSLLNQIGKLRAGSAWTGPEIARLIKEIPNANMSDPQFEAALNNVDDILRRKLESIEKVGVMTGTRTKPPVNPEGTAIPTPNRRSTDKPKILGFERIE